MNKEWFKERLKAAGITRQKLAEQIGMCYPSITDVLKGERQLSLEEGAKIAKVLDIPLDDLVCAVRGQTPAVEQKPDTGTIDVDKLSTILQKLIEVNDEEKALKTALSQGETNPYKENFIPFRPKHCPSVPSYFGKKRNNYDKCNLRT